jgi:hypothetical protein
VQTRYRKAVGDWKDIENGFYTNNSPYDNLEIGDAYTFTNLKNIDFNRKNIIQHPLQLDIQI